MWLWLSSIWFLSNRSNKRNAVHLSFKCVSWFWKTKDVSAPEPVPSPDWCWVSEPEMLRAAAPEVGGRCVWDVWCSALILLSWRYVTGQRSVPSVPADRSRWEFTGTSQEPVEHFRVASQVLFVRLIPVIQNFLPPHSESGLCCSARCGCVFPGQQLLAELPVFPGTNFLSANIRVFSHRNQIPESWCFFFFSESVWDLFVRRGWSVCRFYTWAVRIRLTQNVLFRVWFLLNCDTTLKLQEDLSPKPVTTR